jgi:Predicted membrane protein
MKILSFLTFLFAALTILFGYLDKRFVYFFKPGAMIFIITAAFLYGERGGFYKRMILAGLLFSLAGDVLLIEPQNFVYGLAAFLVAHLFYIAAFARAGAGHFKPASLGAYLIGLAIVLAIYGGVPAELKIPVIFYAAAISTMLCAALNFQLAKRTRQSQFALAGAALFVVSDAILAFNKFGYAFPAAPFFILSTYFLAQWLIARST